MWRLGLRYYIRLRGDNTVTLFSNADRENADAMFTWRHEDSFCSVFKLGEKDDRPERARLRDEALVEFLRENKILMSDRDNYLATKRREYDEKSQGKHTP